MSMVFAAAVCWGLSGTASEALFHQDGFTAGWLVAVRMLAAGGILLAVAALRGHPIGAVWRRPGHARQLLIFGVVALLGVQWTYLAAIAASNAPTATLLQYLGPLLLILWVHRTDKNPLGWRPWIGAVLALGGIVLLVGAGGSHGASVSAAALVLGLSSAVLLAVYSWYPRRLLRQDSALTIVGWAMLTGGLAAVALNPVWETTGQVWRGDVPALIGFVVLLGTVVPFSLYVAATRRIPPTTAAVLASSEPLAATIAAVLWLHASWTLEKSLGGLAIVATVIVLAPSGPTERVGSDTLPT